jgi:hypothetical protein
LSRYWIYVDDLIGVVKARPENIAGVALAARIA